MLRNNDKKCCVHRHLLLPNSHHDRLVSPTAEIHAQLGSTLPNAVDTTSSTLSLGRRRNRRARVVDVSQGHDEGEHADLFLHPAW